MLGLAGQSLSQNQTQNNNKQISKIRCPISRGFKKAKKGGEEEEEEKKEGSVEEEVEKKEEKKGGRGGGER